MDEAYGLHCEDLDLMYRLKEQGHICLFVPVARVFHQQGVSSRTRPLWVHWQKHLGMQRFFLEIPGSKLHFAVAMAGDRRNLVAFPADAPYWLFSAGEGLMKESILVTGARNQLGVFLLPRLRTAGFRVLATSRKAPLNPLEVSPGVHWSSPESPMKPELLPVRQPGFLRAG